MKRVNPRHSLGAGASRFSLCSPRLQPHMIDVSRDGTTRWCGAALSLYRNFSFYTTLFFSFFRNFSLQTTLFFSFLLLSVSLSLFCFSLAYKVSWSLLSPSVFLSLYRFSFESLKSLFPSFGPSEACTSFSFSF